MSELYDLFTEHPRISTDSRRIEPDSIFFALHGANFDGNRFARAALELGAAAAVVDDRERYDSSPELHGRLF
ncbi:MAG: UDP-N-acetylmuramoyl-tripeptide--D-alanyl-D-alanine ligase, partial [Alistipes sp.]|nr:UDP-N-acetylmuramoyl-tripeptide--D-alanyl-D-alanine ligase [Alistipes sp.]